MSYEFKICSFNLGSSNDYLKSCQYFNKINKLNLNLDFKSREDDENFLNGYKDVEKANAEYLSKEAHVYCLQEVTSENRELIMQLKDKNFEIIHFENEDKFFDTAIAIDKKRFKNITNRSIAIKGNGDIAIATAVDRLTGQKIVFASGHVPGFNYLNKTVIEEEEKYGDEYCEVFTQQLNEINDGSLQMVGIDMNATPFIKWGEERIDEKDIQSKSGQKRFTYFNDFTFRPTRCPTSVNEKGETHNERELDFFFSKIKKPKLSVFFILSLICAIFVETFSNNRYSILSDRDDKLWGNLELNCSDHVPIYHTVTAQMNSSIISVIWNFAIAPLKWLFGRSKAEVTK